MASNPDTLRRQAKKLRKSFQTGDGESRARVRVVFPGHEGALSHTNALHVVAQELGFASWPRLKLASDVATMDRDARADRLKQALYFGQHWVVEQLLAEDPTLGRANFALACALYDVAHVRSELARDPGVALVPVGPRRPILHLAFSQHLAGGGDPEAMRAVGAALLAAGADLNDGFAADPENDHKLSALYGAIGHARNLALVEWLLRNGADPNDDESLYHATETGSPDAVRLLLVHGARPQGTNALLRALDFNDHQMVALLLEAGADPNEKVASHPSGEAPAVISALHQAARRMCDAEMARLLVQAGADTSARFEGITPFAMARVFGNDAMAAAIAEAGGVTSLTTVEEKLSDAAAGNPVDGWIDPHGLPEIYRNLIRHILHLPGRMPHLERLVALGLEYDRPDEMGLTPVQLAGWEGLPEVMEWFLSLKPDLSHVNGYGGTLLSTIVHGSENCPDRAARDHIACARLALEEGVALPRRAPKMAVDPEMAGFLAEWAQGHPGQVVENGPV